MPTAAPENVKGKVIDSRTLQISWSPPPLNKQHGTLTYFKIKYVIFEDGKASKEKTRELKVDANKLSHTLKYLQKWSKYQISVLAGNQKGDGPYSDPIYLQTDEDGMW